LIAAIYARKSTEQAGIADEQKSVARQVEHARTYAAAKGWTVSDAHVFVDDGISGAEFAGRPGFLRLMNALKPRAPFQVLVMSEESRLGREAIETAYALKQLVTGGVRVFFYLEDRERTLDSPTDKIMLSLTAFADELEREKARQRTYDAMVRKARAGHVTGGRVFGYDNVAIAGAGGTRSHVELRINADEAAVVREIFERATRGEGLKTIAKALNVAGLRRPRPQQGRPSGWAPSSVREILYRDLYRGRRVWNRTRKRDAWGQKRRSTRAAEHWLELPAEDLRIIAESKWQAAHGRFKARRANYERWRQGDATGAPDGRGVRKRYFLAGFAKCSCCGGSMQVVSRVSGDGRQYRYVCGTYWNRGASICANGLALRMPDADAAVRELLAREVLRPSIVRRALDQALGLWKAERDDDGRQAAIRGRLLAVETELGNLAETAARGGAVPIVLEALTRRENERRDLRAQLDELAASRPFQVDEEHARAKLDAFIGDWSGLVTANVAEARDLLDLVLTDRITCLPTPSASKRDRQYTLTVPIAFDRVMTAAVPELGKLQDILASPTGFDRILQREYTIVLAAA
jgi:DNA invertase Pin-like site-specific DNA recombinase